LGEGVITGEGFDENDFSNRELEGLVEKRNLGEKKGKVTVSFIVLSAATGGLIQEQGKGEI